MIINGLILAAGMSRRMQQFKPLMKIEEKTMIETTVDNMLEAGVSQITVVLGYRGLEVQQVLESDINRKKRLQFAYNSEYETTQMLDSIKVGLKEMGTCDRFFLAPGDMPAISVSTYQRLKEFARNNRESKVLFPTLEGYRKHPPLISWNCREDMLEFQGKGLRELWKQYEEEIVELPMNDNGCTMDVDTPKDFQEMRKYLTKRSNIISLEK
ncbi:MAG: nucleotidyltransferase family protein [Tyzzerella sp.]|nr:nucleotidyltransferase family protein [Tyzzerella sp.]